MWEFLMAPLSPIVACIFIPIILGYVIFIIIEHLKKEEK